jgi:hypothetical protein
MALQFDTRWGAPYWIERRESLAFDPVEDIHSLEDLTAFGPFREEDLRNGPALRFVPRRFYDRIGEFILSETGGATGRPKRVYFSQEEFRAGFIDPFVAVAQKAGWPRGANWLYLGPSGPHIIGRVVEPICRELDSPPPFRIDFDPRWARRLTPGSAARTRYLEHLADQAVDILAQEEIEVLFATPPLVERLAERLEEGARYRIRAVHYGGTALTLEQYQRFQDTHFPMAVHLSGYGNSLVGVAFEASSKGDNALCYYPSAVRHQVRLIPLEGESIGGRLKHDVALGQTGQVVASRLDATCFIPNLVERDCAEAVDTSHAAKSLGWAFPGIRNPRPLPSNNGPSAGFY